MNSAPSSQTLSHFFLSDNAEHTSKLLEFAAAKLDAQFLFFAERPKDHWWPGKAIGVAFNPPQ